MKLTDIYRIKPSPEQVAIRETGLGVLQRHFSNALGQRLDWLRRTCCEIDRYSLVSASIAKIRLRSMVRSRLIPEANELRTARVVCIEGRIARQQANSYYKIAHKQVPVYGSIAIEILNIKGLSKTQLAKSIYAVAWGKFLTTLEAATGKLDSDAGSQAHSKI